MSTDMISFPIFGEEFLIDAPRFLTIFGFKIYLYGLFITAGFALAALYLIKRHEVFGLTKDNILDLVIMAVPCGLIGSRIYYIIFNAEQYFGPGKWRNIIMFREGGLAIYGGVIGGVIAILIYSRIKKIHYSKLFDAAGFGLLIGQSIGRWGNFFNREAYGVATDAPWRMGLETAIGVMYVHPTFLYEMLWNGVGLLAMHIFSKKRKAKYHGQYFLFYVAWYGFGRFMIEGIRSDSLYVYGTDIRISQFLAAASFSVAVVLLIRNYLRGKHVESLV
ncbi:MAG: prolipoprotein diacylglyceryl transferase [Oscillospiraceae bacterium]|nr:prolipoprotein diacylglyceryl transferase [Oscillospiraceae bacterium]